MQAVSELERLSGLIDFIYQGATEPALWPEIVAAASDWLGSPKGMLYTPLHGVEQGGFYFQHGLSDFFLELYKTRYQAVDMWTAQVVARDLFKEGHVLLGTDLVPHTALRQSQWYRDCLQVGGIAHLLSSVVFAVQSPQPGVQITDMPTACSFYRGAGDPEYTETDRRKLALLLPHVSRALGVMTRLQLSDCQVAASLSALDRLPSAVLLMAGSGEVLFANRAANALLASGDALRIEPADNLGGGSGAGLGRLVARQASVNRDIARALSAAKRISGATHFSSVVKVPTRQPGCDWLLQLSRVQLGAALRHEAGISRTALRPDLETAMRPQDQLPEVIAFLTDTQRPLDVDTALLRRTYGLTAAEARVAAAATAAGSVDELAAALALAVNTVKTHLRNVYAKTGVTGRAELIRLLLGMAALD